MKIDFDDSSFVEIVLSTTPGKVLIILGAKDSINPLKTVINSAEITIKNLAELVSDLKINLPPVLLKNNN
jgi:hypothetical protein